MRFASKLYAGLLAVPLSCLLLAQSNQVPDAQRTGFAAIQERDLRSDLALIASDALEGRMSLQPGDDAAAQWVASEFQKAGLQPAFGDSYLQPVPLIEYHPDRARSYVAVQTNGSERKWEFPNAYGSFPRDVDASGAVVFAGYGITAPEMHYDDYAGLDVRGKIVLLFDHEPQENNPESIFNGTGNTRYATTRVKLVNAQAHGAIGALIVAEPNRKHPSNQERVARIGGTTTRAVPLPAQALAGDPLQIPSATISDAIAKELFATANLSPSELQSSIDRDLKPQSRSLPGAHITISLRNASTREASSYNAVGLLTGSDAALKAETILISAHHDHDGKSLDQIWHGADDNGSGTVGVVELAHAFAVNPAKPKRSILFVVFAAEERGLLGAFYMTQHPLRPLATTRAMINFDMIGRDEAPSQQTQGLIDIPAVTTNRLNLIGATYSPDYNKTVERENRLIGLTLDYRFDHESALNVFFRSDQFPFVLQNIPAFWWFTGFHPDYHHVTDTADKIDYRKMNKILQLAYLSAWQFADQTNPPRFIANP